MNPDMNQSPPPYHEYEGKDGYEGYDGYEEGYEGKGVSYDQQYQYDERDREGEGRPYVDGSLVQTSMSGSMDYEDYNIIQEEFG